MYDLKRLDQTKTGNPDIDRLLSALWNNRMGATYVEHASDVAPIVESLLTPGEQVSHGGTHSLDATGVEALISSGAYDYLDRASATTPEQKADIMRRALLCDTYLGSANALIRTGEIFNVDMQANRVAAMLYGPNQVILVVGMNKVVDTLDDAVARVKSIAAPVNMRGLDKGAPCQTTGECVSLASGGGCANNMARGCAAPGRICCNYVVMSRQSPNHDQRIKVILVGEDLGY